MLSQYERLQSDMFAVISRNNSGYPVRFHKDIEVQYVLDGDLEMSVNKRSYRLGAGDLCVVFPNLLHGITAQKCAKYLLNVDPVLVSGLGDMLNQTQPVCPVLRAEEVPPVIPVLLGRCAQLYRAGGNEAVMHAHASALVNELISLLDTKPRDSAADPVQRIVEFILTNYTENITLEQMGKELGYSKYHVSHVIGGTFDCNFRTLLNDYRIHSAQMMLNNTTKSIGQIMYDCGFQSQSAFNRAFLRCCGMTPVQYRGMGNCASE